MKVIIKEHGSEKPIVIRVPLSIAANPLIAALGAANTEFTFEQLNKFMRALRKAKKHLEGQPFVDVVSSDGDEVKVYL